MEVRTAKALLFAVLLGLWCQTLEAQSDRLRSAVVQENYQDVVAAVEPAGQTASQEAQAYLRQGYRGLARLHIAAGNRTAASRVLDKLRALELGTQPAEAKSGSWQPADETELAKAEVRLLGIDLDVPAHAMRPQPQGSPGEPQGEWTDIPSLLRQADLLFQASRFQDAGQLYSRIHELAPDALVPAESRWTYCRLFGIVQRINAQPDHPDGDKLERELDEILSRLPASSRANSLRAQIAMRTSGSSGPEIVRANSPDTSTQRGLLAGLASRISLGMNKANGVARLARRWRSNEWEVLETENFRVHHNDASLAGIVADIAERARIELYKTWFGSANAETETWTPKCDIFLYDSARAYARATGQDASSPGHSATRINAGLVTARRVDLRADGPDLVKAILPHEVTHIVMADRFLEQELPRWADEGIAILSEPEEKKYAHLRNLNRFLSQGQLYAARDLMTMNNYPASGQLWPLFYAQSVSLVQFLVDRQGPRELIEFLAVAQKLGPESALHRVYGYSSFAELDRAWAESRQVQLAELPSP